MLRLLRLLALIAIAVSVPAIYYVPWLKTEWNIGVGGLAFERRDFPTAVEYLASAVHALEQRNHVRRSQHYRRMLAQSHLALKHEDQALTHYRALVLSDQSDAIAHFVLGLHAMKAGELGALRGWRPIVRPAAKPSK